MRRAWRFTAWSWVILAGCGSGSIWRTDGGRDRPESDGHDAMVGSAGSGGKAGKAGTSGAAAEGGNAGKTAAGGHAGSMGGRAGVGGASAAAGGGAGNIAGAGGTAGSAGAGDPHVSGVLSWARRLTTGTRSDRARAVATTAGGAIYVGGTFDSSSAFWAGTPDQRTVSASGGSYDMFLARVGPSGTLEWLRTAGNDSYGDQVLAVAPFGDDVLVAGSHGDSTTGDFVLGPGEPSETHLTLNGFFFAHYRADGSLAWARATGGNHFGEIDRIAATASGGFVAAGAFYGNVTFGPGEPNQTTLSNNDSNVNNDAYLALFDSLGNLSWAQQVRGPQNDLVQDVAIAPDGSIVVVGTFVDKTVLPSRDGAAVTLSTAAGDGSDLFIATYETTGALRWARQVTGPAQVDSHGLAMLADGSFVITGAVTPTGAAVPDAGQAVFGPGEPNQTALIGTYFDLFVARYDSSGRLSWAKLAPGALPGYHNAVPLAGGDIVVVGTFGNVGTTPRTTGGLRPWRTGPDHADPVARQGISRTRSSRITERTGPSSPRGPSPTARPRSSPGPPRRPTVASS